MKEDEIILNETDHVTITCNENVLKKEISYILNSIDGIENVPGSFLDLFNSKIKHISIEKKENVFQIYIDFNVKTGYTIIDVANEVHSKIENSINNNFNLPSFHIDIRIHDLILSEKESDFNEKNNIK